MEVLAPPAAEYRGIESTPWLEETCEEQQTITDFLMREYNASPRLDIPIARSTEANVSYGRKAVAWGRRVGVRVIPHTFGGDDATADFIANVLAPDPDVDRVLAILPSNKPEGEEAIRFALPEGQDVDGMTLRLEVPLLVPATAEAMGVCAVRLANRQLKELGTVGVIGYGDRTCKPLVERVLKEQEITPAIILKTSAEINALNEKDPFVPELLACDTLFAAVPVGGLLTRERVRAGQTIVDGGFGIHPETNKACGCIDPEVWSLGGLVKATAFRRGVGPITVAITLGRTIDARLAKLGLDKQTVLELAAAA
jgi:5,10-methylene-tetrahydrofolate dehydrogenase/methenyl tetrahydrofolate cyclohydrolase